MIVEGTAEELGFVPAFMEYLQEPESPTFVCMNSMDIEILKALVNGEHNELD